METNSWASMQLSGARLGDRRRNERAAKLMSGLAGGGSLPEACGGERGELVAAYRLLNQEAVSPASLQEAHRQACAARISREAVVLCVQDSSELAGGKPAGLGKLATVAVGVWCNTARWR